MNIFFSAVFISVLLWFSVINARADLFERYHDPLVLRQEALRLDRGGYDSALSKSGEGGVVGPVDQENLPPALRRNWSPKSVSDIDPEEVFDKDLRRMIERDRKGTTSFTPVLSNNMLLLMSYASPAMADILKHYRTLAYARMNMEYTRFAQKENLSAGTLELFYRASLDACVYQKRIRGLLGALEVCRKEPPLGHIKDPAGRFVTIQKPWAIVMDTLTRMGLESRKARLAVALAGDVIIDPEGIKETAPTSTFYTESAQRAQEQIRDWIEITKKFSETKPVADIELENLSWPGFLVSRDVMSDVMTLTETQRILFVSQAAGLAASESARNDLQRAVLFLDRGMGRSGVDEALKGVLGAKKRVMELILAERKEKESGFRSAEDLFQTLLEDADTVRKGALLEEKERK